MLQRTMRDRTLTAKANDLLAEKQTKHIQNKIKEMKKKLRELNQQKSQIEDELLKEQLRLVELDNGQNMAQQNAVHLTSAQTNVDTSDDETSLESSSNQIVSTLDTFVVEDWLKIADELYRQLDVLNNSLASMNRNALWTPEGSIKGKAVLERHLLLVLGWLRDANM